MGLDNSMGFQQYALMHSWFSWRRYIIQVLSNNTWLCNFFIDHLEETSMIQTTQLPLPKAHKIIQKL